MKIKFAYVILLVSFFFYGINLVSAEKRQKPLFKVVDVPDSIRAVLACIELGKDRLETSYDSSYMPFLIHNLISPKDYVLKDGIYEWAVMGPHFKSRIFIYYKGKFQIFKSTEIDGLLAEYWNYLKTSDLPEPLRIRYLMAISEYLKGWYENEHGKIDSKRRKK